MSLLDMVLESKRVRVDDSPGVQSRLDSWVRQMPHSLRKKSIERGLDRVTRWLVERLTEAADGVARGKSVKSAVEKAREAMMEAFAAAGNMGFAIAGLPKWKITDDQIDILNAFIEEEVGFFTAFMQEIAKVANEARVSNEAKMGRSDRLGLYGGAVGASFWRSWLGVLPSRAVIHWRLTVAEHCASCLDLAAGGPYSKPGMGRKPLPTVPRNGDTLCILDASARVLTRSGGGRDLVALIANVREGDMVWTHKNRWRTVTNVIVGRAGAGRTASIIESSIGTLRLTDDHEVYTPTTPEDGAVDGAGWDGAGWVAAADAGLQHLPIFTNKPGVLARCNRWEIGLACNAPTFDLTVDEDHSFVCEGVVVHNCLGNCRCYLEADLGAGVNSGLYSNVGVELVTLGGRPIDPMSPAGLAAAELYREMIERWAWHTRMAALETGSERARHELLANQSFEQAKAYAIRNGHTVRLTVLRREVLEPVTIARGLGYRYIRPEDLNDDLVLAVATVLAMNWSDRGKITAVKANPPTVTLDDDPDRVYRLDGVGRAVLFIPPH